MSTESEFETVVPDTDIESGAVSSSGLIAPQSSAPKEAQAPASSGFRFLNFSGLQQVGNLFLFSDCSILMLTRVISPSACVPLSFCGKRETHSL